MTTSRSEQLVIGITLIIIVLLAAWFIPQKISQFKKSVKTQFRAARYVRV